MPPACRLEISSTRPAASQGGLRTIRTSLFANDEENTDGLATRAGVFAGTGFTFRNNNSQLRLMLSYFPKRCDRRCSAASLAVGLKTTPSCSTSIGSRPSTPMPKRW